MKVRPADGGWVTGPLIADIPLVAVLEVSGAVLSWPVDAPEPVPHIAFTDVRRADWLWRVVGETGHSALLDALTPAPADVPVDLPGVEVDTDAVAALRRLALGHWLRRWWPASRVDGLTDLDRTVLDAELAVLTWAAEDFFTDDTVDSDPAELLAPHLGEISVRARLGDPRLADLGAACAELADDLGIAAPAVDAHTPGSRDDYALVAGGQPSDGPSGGAIATGAGPIAWSAVPPGVFDATENAVHWTVRAPGEVTADVRTTTLGDRSPAGIPVTLSSGTVTGAGALDAAGRVVLALRRDGAALGETAAWDHDWRDTTVTVGAATAESAEVRDRIRRFARSRLDDPAADAFLAEVLAAESDY